MNLRETIKTAAYRAFARSFDRGARKGVLPDRVVFFHLTAGNFLDSMDRVERELRKRGDYEILHVSREELTNPRTALRFMTRTAFSMGRARYLFLNNNFFPLGYTHPAPETTVVQLWHGMGAFKKFGFDIPQPPEVREKELGAVKNVDYVVCSAPQIRPIYASAFHMDPEQVLTTGTPIQDFYFDPANVGEDAIKKHRRAFDDRYPACRGKYLVFYAPTFRDDPEEGAALLDHMDFLRLRRSAEQGAEKEAVILVRLHPNDEASHQKLRAFLQKHPEEGVVDVTDYPDGNELSLLSDVMITDYSSICMNNALLRKPIVLYAYDLDDYKDARNFYFDYEKTAPGPVVRTMDELCTVFAEQDFHPERLEQFRELHFGDPDGHAAEKLVDAITSP